MQMSREIKPKPVVSCVLGVYLFLKRSPIQEEGQSIRLQNKKLIAGLCHVITYSNGRSQKKILYSIPEAIFEWPLLCAE